MKLEDIGFYTLSDERAANVSVSSPLMRCELILTDRCNFRCPYCRELNQSGDISFADAVDTIGFWGLGKLKNIRFSGGEPTLHPHLLDFVKLATDWQIQRIAISTNGSAPLRVYEELLSAGVSDFSISLDGSCCSTVTEMSGTNNSKYWTQIIQNIQFLSKRTYVTVGIVFTEHNVEEAVNTVLFADSLGVSDIRVIPSAQYNRGLERLQNLPEEILNKYPILRYRIERSKKKLPIRGIREVSAPCFLVLDDMAVMKNKHYPCIIYLREGGKPIGEVNSNMRQEREKWMLSHQSHLDPICKKNCLDVCCIHNQKVAESCSEIISYK